MGASLVGRYELLAPVGQGGMAELFLARVAGDPRGQVFVIKRILPRHAHDPRFVEMFQRELSIAKGVYHPNLVPVLDHGEADGSCFMVMEYVYGVDLAELLDGCGERGVEVPIGVGVSIALQAALGLHHLHEQPDREGGKPCLVHRDVSPSNVMLGYDGVAKVTDFGIATATAYTRTTEAGTMKGKAGYMSPEQCRGDALDRRSDVFALGILLYEVTVGERLFVADNDYALMNRILEGRFERPSKRRSGYPPGLESIVMRALATDREQRYATANDMAAALRRFADASALTVAPPQVAAFIADTLGKRPYPAFPVIPSSATMPVHVPTAVTMVPQRPAKSRNLTLVAVAGIAVLAVTTVVAATGSASPEPDASSASAADSVPAATRPRVEDSAPPPQAIPAPAQPVPPGSSALAEPAADALPSEPERGAEADTAAEPPSPDELEGDDEEITIAEEEDSETSSPPRRRKRKKASPTYDLDAPRPPQ